MAPKKASARADRATTAKRPIRGPSQALRSPAPSQSLGRVQSFMAGIADDPAAMTRFAAEMDGVLQRCSTRPPAPTRPPQPLVPSSPTSSLSSELGGEGPSTSTAGLVSRPTRPSSLPATRASSRRARRSSRRVSRGKTPSTPASRRNRAVQPLVEVASGSGTSHVVSSVAPGPSRQDLDSGSSMEDSLPVPARRSLGGKRRHKRSSRKHAKRRREDSSSSYTGTSSSSDDELGGPIELYWGFGEEASGLPRWAWERRANAHRAKYGAVQECRDGVLVPDVKVSTNSARDIIPGSHLATKLRSRILNGRYVDMFKLAPPSEDQEKADFPKKRPGNPTVDKTFEHWLDCFQVFAGVVVAAYPRRSLHLFVYLSIVRSAFTKAGEKAAIKYDENFRRRAARIPSARWDRRDLDVWTTHVAPLIDKRVPEQQKPKSAAFRTSRRMLCWDFNKGSCQRQGCKYAHSCEKCGGTHAAAACFSGRRPFRGGRGGAQQNPRPTPSTATAASGK
ncbi:uncharacterized protein LOC144329089 [Podarcis muralis]